MHGYEVAGGRLLCGEQALDVGTGDARTASGALAVGLNEAKEFLAASGNDLGGGCPKVLV